MKKICKNCGKCCIETEMIVSDKDIQLIKKRISNIKKTDFLKVNEKGFYQLKNEDKKCVFLDKNTKLCKIYGFRPQGCKFYPIIYDRTKKKCIYDEYCPRVSLFYLGHKRFENKCEEIKKFLISEVKLDIS